MAKTIAVWGSPNSGKTTFATKLAREIYDEYQSTVIVVYADMETPTLPVIFPNYKKYFAPLIEAGKKILYTSDGTYTAFIGDLAAAGASPIST